MMHDGYPLRKYTIKDWLLIIITSSLVLQLLTTLLTVNIVSVFPGYLRENIQFNPEGLNQLIYQAAAIGTIISLPLTLLVIYKHKIPFFNRKQLSKEESFIIRGLTKEDWKFLLYYIPASFILYSLGYSLVVSVFGEGEAINQLAIEEMFNYVPIWQIFLMTVVVAPIVEEILFRGLVLFSRGTRETTWLRVIISSILFGLVHNPTNISSLYTYVGMGFIFSYAGKKTETLEAAMIYHFLNNLMGFLSLLLYLN